MKVQLEVTTSCNLDCEYCFRKRNGFADITREIVEKIADADEVVLYGYGEPLLNPSLKDYLKIISGKTLISTNGMVNGAFDEVFDMVDRIAISLDFDARHRKGLVFEKLKEKLDMAGDKAVTQIVVTSDNIGFLPELVRISAESGADVQLTNVVAGNMEIYGKTLYFEGSRFNVDMISDIDNRFILSAIKDWSRGRGRFKEAYQKLIRKIYSQGYSVNIPYIVESRERIERARNAEMIVGESIDIAKEYGVDFERAEFFGNSKARECPYEDMIFVRVDGRVSSCMTFAYTHNEFVNGHHKTVNEFVFADLKTDSIDDAFESKAEFERLRKNMDDSFPWCADCPYVSGCWYAKQNIDCYANKVSCSECLYSSKIARCVV